MYSECNENSDYDMNPDRLAAQFQCSLIALVLISILSSRAVAQNVHARAMTAERDGATPALSTQATALTKIVRDSTNAPRMCRSVDDFRP